MKQTPGPYKKSCEGSKIGYYNVHCILEEKSDTQQKCIMAMSRIAQIETSLKSLKTFSGDINGLPLKTWIENVEDLARIDGWSQYETFYAAKKSLTGAAAEWLQWMQTTGQVKCWLDLKVELKKTFLYEVNEFQVLEKLRTEGPKRGESLLQYMYRMRRLASQASVSDKLTLAYTINGIEAFTFHDLRLNNCQTFAELKAALLTYDEKKLHNILSYKMKNILLTLGALLLFLFYKIMLSFILPKETSH